MKRFTLFFILLLLTACSVAPVTPVAMIITMPPPPSATPLPTATALPTETPIPPTSTSLPGLMVLAANTSFPSETPIPSRTPDPVSCADLDVAWSRADWALTLNILDRLQIVDLTCGETSLTAKKYSAHLNYAITLEWAKDQAGAIAQYQAALAVRTHGPEAVAALLRLHAKPQALDAPCFNEHLDPYTPSDQSFVGAVGNQLRIDDQPFIARGVNYYPRNTPWDRFLPDSSLGDIGKELHLISAAGFNTIRIFLWYDPLFDCAPETATPDAAAFKKLDGIISMAARLNLRLIVTLNDLPDLTFRPLYTDYDRYDAQTAFIVDRYKDEPAILAWDLRNEGDIDYQSPKHPNRDAVLAWLKHIAGLVRAIDSQHLTTAGWLQNSLETADLVDILSFHHWSGVQDLTSQIKYLTLRSPKPILVEEIGYASPNKAETSQAKLLGAAVNAVEQKGAAGWLVWTAFDFPPTGDKTNPQNDYGLWHNDLSPKPALSALPITPLP